RTARSVPSTSPPPGRIRIALAGMSGRFAEMSVHVTPLSRDSNTCPTPAPGPSVHLREKPLIATYTWAGSAGSTSKPDTYRFGTVPSTGRVSWCQPVPSVLPTAIPRAKPWLLHGPHQPADTTPCAAETAGATWPAPRSYTPFHSAPLRIAKPLRCTH